MLVWPSDKLFFSAIQKLAFIAYRCFRNDLQMQNSLSPSARIQIPIPEVLMTLNGMLGMTEVLIDIQTFLSSRPDVHSFQGLRICTHTAAPRPYGVPFGLADGFVEVLVFDNGRNGPTFARIT